MTEQNDKEFFKLNLDLEFEYIKNSHLKDFGLIVNKTDEDPNKWILTMKVPEDAIYSNKVENNEYKLSITFGENYPETKPDIRFITKIEHDDVNENGEINVKWLNNLKAGRKIAYILPRLLTLFYLKEKKEEKEEEEEKEDD